MLGVTSSSQLMSLGKQLGLSITIKTKDKLPKKLMGTKNYIINLDDSTGTGTHWVALHSSKEQGTIYFDSFGMPPPKEVLDLAKSSNRKAIQLEIQAQAINEDSCGYYCLFFLSEMNMGTSPAKFLSLLSTTDQRKNESLLRKWAKKYLNL